ncbi:MAG: hypothetical protein DBX59_09240 [Bacillota bacterium]|nr:MAG: hypothetical protein DBX59_09240 [Bacillota bacterium]
MHNAETATWKRFFFSELLLTKSVSQRIAYIAVVAALSVVSNMFLEFKFFDVQFSVTIVVSAVAGILLGPIGGFAACYIGDLAGYLYNSWGLMYMPWVGLSTAMLALIGGGIMNIPLRFKGALYVKLALVCVLSLFVCTIGINSTGFYFYNKTMGFSDAVINYVSEKFGAEVGYFGYLAYRLFFKGQIYNNLVNYALLFAVVPLLGAIKPLKIEWK